MRRLGPRRRTCRASRRFLPQDPERRPRTDGRAGQSAKGTVVQVRVLKVHPGRRTAAPTQPSRHYYDSSRRVQAMPRFTSTGSLACWAMLGIVSLCVRPEHSSQHGHESFFDRRPPRTDTGHILASMVWKVRAITESGGQALAGRRSDRRFSVVVADGPSEVGLRLGPDVLADHVAERPTLHVTALEVDAPIAA